MDVIGVENTSTDTLDLVAPKFGVPSITYQLRVKELQRYLNARKKRPRLAKILVTFPKVDGSVLIPLCEVAEEKWKKMEKKAATHIIPVK